MNAFASKEERFHQHLQSGALAKNQVTGNDFSDLLPCSSAQSFIVPSMTLICVSVSVLTIFRCFYAGERPMWGIDNPTVIRL